MALEKDKLVRYRFTCKSKRASDVGGPFLNHVLVLPPRENPVEVHGRRFSEHVLYAWKRVTEDQKDPR